MTTPQHAAPTSVERDRHFLDLAVEQAQIGWDEGGIPIGAVLVHHDTVLAAGRNRRIQLGSPIRHAETDCIDLAGRQHASVYRECVLYTTLSPCIMCAGTALLYNIPRIVIGENTSFEASEELLASSGVELTILDDPRCKSLMDRMIAERPELWFEDIGELR